jgi:hypothetical protein
LFKGFNPAQFLTSDKVAPSIPFKKSEPISLPQPPLPSPTLLGGIEIDKVTFSSFCGRDQRLFVDHFLAINEETLLPHFQNYLARVRDAGAAAEPAPVFDKPDGPTASKIYIPTIGQSTHDILYSGNPEQIGMGSPSPSKRKKRKALVMPSGGLATSGQIFEQLEEIERGFSYSLH